MRRNKKYVIVIDNNSLKEYEEYYFKTYPKRRKFPFKNPIHPSINVWCRMRRPQMNLTKQRWGEFIIWLVNKHGYSNLKISSCEIFFDIYFDTKRRHDSDNYVPKFINDGLIESGMIIDDDFNHIEKMTITGGYDKENPRMVITIVCKGD